MTAGQIFYMRERNQLTTAVVLGNFITNYSSFNYYFLRRQKMTDSYDQNGLGKYFINIIASVRVSDLTFLYILKVFAS